MSHFIFKARKPSGEIYKGDKDAKDRYELYRMIKESGDEIVSVKEKAGKRPGGAGFSINIFGKRVKTIDKINFARNLGSMLEAGLALSRALSVLERQSKSKNLKSVITELIADINRGSAFADALANHPKIFSPLFISMVHAGEQGGTLASSLRAVANQMKNSHDLDRRIRGAMMYPAVIFSAMILIAILMFIFVIPTLMKTFTDLNVPLPWMTRLVLNISSVIQNWGLLVLAGLVVLAFAYMRWIKRPSGKRIVHALILKIPVIGALVREVNTARTARTLSSLFGSGVDIVESVNITSNVVQNVHFRAVLDRAKEAIKKGDLMSKVFAEENENIYPVFFSEMMSVGEETGKMGEVLMGVANYYEEDVELKTKDMSTVIEPFLMLVIGAAVGFFAVSMISPMYSLVNAI